MLNNPDGFYEVSWKISNWCNLNCPYCINHHKEADEPPFFDIARKINDLMNLRQENGTQIYITGGEPYLRPINEIIPLWTSPYLNRVRITSNMTAKVDSYLETRELLESNGKRFLLKASFHEEKLPFENQKKWIDRCFDCKADFINIVVNDDNYVDYLILLQNFDFDGDALIRKGEQEIKVNWMVERLSGGGVSDKVKTIPKSSRTFDIKEQGCKCSAGWNTVRIEPYGDVKRCFKLKPEGNILTDDLSKFLFPKVYECHEKKCPGCINAFIYDKNDITFYHMVEHDKVDVGG